MPQKEKIEHLQAVRSLGPKKKKKNSTVPTCASQFHRISCPPCYGEQPARCEQFIFRRRPGWTFPFSVLYTGSRNTRRAPPGFPGRVSFDEDRNATRLYYAIGARSLFLVSYWKKKTWKLTVALAINRNSRSGDYFSTVVNCGRWWGAGKTQTNPTHPNLTQPNPTSTQPNPTQYNFFLRSCLNATKSTLCVWHIPVVGWGHGARKIGHARLEMSPSVFLALSDSRILICLTPSHTHHVVFFVRLKYYTCSPWEYPGY